MKPFHPICRDDEGAKGLKAAFFSYAARQLEAPAPAKARAAARVTVMDAGNGESKAISGTLLGVKKS